MKLYKVAREICLILPLGLQVSSCKEVDSKSSKVRNIVVTGDGKGFGGLADITFDRASSDNCGFGGLVYQIYNDVNSSGSPDSGEKLKESYKNCYATDPKILEQDRASMKEFKVSSGNAKVTNKDELEAYWESADPSTKLLLSQLDPNFTTYESFDEVPLPVQLNEAGKLFFTEYPVVYDWDFALLGVVNVKELVAGSRNIFNFESIQFSKEISRVVFENVALTSDQLKALYALPKLSSLTLHRTAIADPSLLIPFIKKNPALTLSLDIQELPEFTGPVLIR